ncbi:membrane protein containing ATP-binding region, ATPase-like domain protein [Candidatus Magnetomorum sp. HK-1]|nr:membrane protein containing ATP-binding region, ATPase-like domain protein [Candidatus Magnetomorum sp. HK-1]
MKSNTRPFRLVKYVTFTSMIFVFMGTLIMSLLIMQWARSMLLSKSEDYALLLAENLNHQIFLQFVIPVAIEVGKIQLSNKSQYDRLDRVVRGTLHSFEVDQVYIYDMDHVISYSFDQKMTGLQNMGGIGYFSARSGKATSRLLQKGNFFELMIGLPNISKLSTYIPLRAEKSVSNMSGPILGILEIVQDLSQDYIAVFRFKFFIIITSLTVMGLLALALIYVVIRGEKIIRKRTEERLKLEEQLRLSERFAALGEMAAGVSHEIRNPLGIIRSSAQLLKKKMNIFDPANNLPGVIIEETGRLNDIVTGFLMLSRPSNPTFKTCQISEILNKNTAFLSPEFEKSKCEVKTLYQNNLPKIKADKNMLYQAFLNLLINAMQAMPNGGLISISVTADRNDIWVVIDDEGEGIPDEILAKIWDPFYTSKEKGTGLGLSIVKNIIEVHQGAISLENRSIYGSQVRIRLPAESSFRH